MANEIWCNYGTGADLYAIIRLKSDATVYNGATFETWDDGNIGDYDIALTEQGNGFYSADFPEIDADTYYVTIYVMAGAIPAVGDRVIYNGKLEWDGTEEYTLTMIYNKVSDVLVAVQTQQLYIYNE
jgi:hypothetical protein